MRKPAARIFLSVFATLTVVLGCMAGDGVEAAPSAVATSPIKHVIEIMLENHTFDNLFGAFPGADGIPNGTTFPNPGAYFDSEPNVAPVWAGPNQGDVQGGIDNSRPGEQMAMDYLPGHGYQMDNYTRYPNDGMSSVTEFPASTDPNLQYLAQHYGLADENFQAAIAPSNPNIHYALTGSANGWMYNNLQPGTGNATWNSIFDEIDGAGLTSKIYYGFPSSELSQYWYQMLPTDRTSDVQPLADLTSDLKNSTLPNFSLVRADYSYYDEEPPEDIEQGDTWLGQMVQAIAQSPDWSSTALFITYDEGGGFWDHVAPPVKTDYGYGTRIPTVIVSPYAATGVFSQQTTNTSISAFMEKLWHMKPLNAFTAGQNDFMGAFDFHRQPVAAPTLPQAPTDTIAFYDSTTSPGPGKTFTVNLQANTPDLTIDSGVSGTVSIKVIPPSGVAVPASFPTTATMARGAVSFTASLPSAGYWRLEASGPGSSDGFTTVDVGVTPNTP